MKRPARLLLVSALVGAGLTASAQPASAAFHLMKIREVLPGTTLSNSEEYVELQMYSSGQNLVATHHLILYSPSGTPTEDFTIPTPVANGGNQRTILFATSPTATGGVTPDFTISAGLDPMGGAVCFDQIDCMSYGNFTGTITDEDGGPGTPAAAPSSGQSLTRRISPGCSTSLEDNDDTNNSVADFETTAPSPRNNSTAPTETACAGGGGGGGQGDPSVSVQNLKAKTPGNKAIISGRIEPADPGGKVKLTLYANGSPMQKVGKKSDTLDGDSRFKKKFAVPSGSTRCKVTVKYNGQEEAKKKFPC